MGKERRILVYRILVEEKFLEIARKRIDKLLKLLRLEFHSRVEDKWIAD